MRLGQRKLICGSDHIVRQCQFCGGLSWVKYTNKTLVDGLTTCGECAGQLTSMHRITYGGFCRQDRKNLLGSSSS